MRARLLWTLLLLSAVFAMQGVVERGGHLGQLIDQHFTRGVALFREGDYRAALVEFRRAYDEQATSR